MAEITLIIVSICTFLYLLGKVVDWIFGKEGPDHPDT